MRTWRGSVRFVFAALAGLFCVGSARAQLAVVATPGDPPALAFAELAYADGAGPPVTWLSLRVQRGPVAIVAALPEDAQAEPGLDAWLASLEATASPNILLPADQTSCFQSASFAHVAWPRGKGAAATELSVQTREDALAALDEQGLELSGELPESNRYLIWSWAAPDTDQTTRTLRIVGGAAPLTLLPGATFPVLVSSVTRGSMALPSELGDDELTVTFVADKRARSDYRERLQDFLTSRSEALLETRARGPLFDWSLYADTVSLASLMRNYASIAGKELPELDTERCANQLGALRDAAAPSPSACGNALDAGLALTAAGSELATLQRFAVSGKAGFAPSDATDGGMASAPVLHARLLDASACGNTDPAPIVVQPPASRSGGGNSAPPSGNTTVVVEQTVVVDDSQPAEVNCGSSPQPQPQDGYYTDNGRSSDSCSSDTSSTSQSDSSSSCSGDSSSSSTSGDTSCSSDTSSTSSSDDSGCSSDTSSSSSSSSSTSSDTSCDGGSNDSYNGDTCTGAAAPGGEPAEKAQASLTSGSRTRRPQRTKTSLWTLAFVAVVLPIRRRKRGLSASG